MKKKQNSLIQGIDNLMHQAASKNGLTLQELIEGLYGKGHAILVILFSLPFSIPITIPGFSTPFGLAIAFVGLRIAFGQKVWLPRSLLQAKISLHILEKVSKVAIKVVEKLKFLTATRLEILVNAPICNLIHGCVIAFLGLLLAVPLPIPFSNTLAALPLLAFGLGILDDDGVLIIVGYVLAGVCVGFFMALAWFGKASFNFLMRSFI